MANLPQALPPRRATRVHLANPTPAVLRFQDGSRLAGNLQIISIAGGLLRLSQPLDPNTRASLMFLTDGGPVLGKAEMLSPLSRTQQAFRFIALDQNNQPPTKPALKIILGSVAFGILVSCPISKWH